MTQDSRHTGIFASLLMLERGGEDQFLGPPAPDRGERTYGGQLLAQGLAACQATVDDGRGVHSLHAYFLSSGAPDRATELRVERMRDGRSFSQRSVSAVQDGREVLRMIASFHVAESGYDYAAARMPAVPPPDAVRLTYADYTVRESGGEPWPGAVRPMDIRYVNAPTAPHGEPVTDDQRHWMRITEPLGDDPGVHAAALVYLSDSTLVDHVVLPQGRRWQEPRLNGASLDHAMWFHRPARADEWLLFDQRAESTGGARGLASGRFFDSTGRLVATCLQEGLARWVD